MPERKIWTQAEDRILRYLKEGQGQKKWSLIARRMQLEFGIAGRSGKQCRQRYHNHLDQAISMTDWTAQEELILFRMHAEVGNKWSLMTQKLQGRTDNCIKNHFYSKLRKAVRKINKVLLEPFNRASQEINMTSLYKILEIGESKFKTNCKYDEQLVDQCLDLKNLLYQLEPFIDSKAPSEEDRRKISNLILLLNLINSKIHKNSKTSKRRDSDGSTSSKVVPQDRTKKQEKEEPFYKMFQRVCEQLVRSD